MRGVIVLLTAATVSFHALEVLTSPLFLWIIPSGCAALGTGTAEPNFRVRLHTERSKTSALSHVLLLDKQIKKLGFKDCFKFKIFPF